MEKLILLTMLAAGCAGAVCEGDEMSCQIPHERYVQQWVTGSSILVPNVNGAACIALGSQDTTGAVVITPQISNSSSIKPIIVSAGAPYVGFLKGPFTVTPIFNLEPLSVAQYAQLDVVDLLVFEQIPPFMPTRAAYFYAGVPSASTMYFRVRGRKRIIVTASTTSSANISFEASVLRDNATFTVDTKAATGVTSLIWQPNPDTLGDGTTKPGLDVIDYLAIISNGTWSHVSVEAWDS